MKGAFFGFNYNWKIKDSEGSIVILTLPTPFTTCNWEVFDSFNWSLIEYIPSFNFQDLIMSDGIFNSKGTE